MASVILQSTAEQIASHLKKEIAQKKWVGKMPGVHRLVEELGVSKNSIESALQCLEREKVLISQGKGRPRLIANVVKAETQGLRIAVILGEKADTQVHYLVEMRHSLMEAGNAVITISKTLSDLKMDVKKVSKLVESNTADAWIVVAASRQILEWFATQKIPAFAIFGRRFGLSIAGVGPDKVPAIADATKKLIDLGHRRIVLVVRQLRRAGGWGRFEHRFISELEANNISVSSFNLPSWNETPAGLFEMFDSLFKVTPPTALILDEVCLFSAAQQYLANRALLVPQNVSLICTDPDPAFEWSRPSVSHIHWEPRRIISRINKWSENVRRGIDDRRQSTTKASFITGGTIGKI